MFESVDMWLYIWKIRHDTGKKAGSISFVFRILGRKILILFL